MNLISRLVRLALPPEWPLLERSSVCNPQAPVRPSVALERPSDVPDGEGPQVLSIWLPKADPQGVQPQGTLPRGVQFGSAPSTALVPSGGAAAKPVASKPAPRPAAGGTPLMDSLIEMLKSGGDPKTHFVQVGGERASAVKGKAIGFPEDGPQQVALRRIIRNELRTYASLRQPPVDFKKLEKIIDLLAECLVAKHRREKGDQLSVEDFQSLCIEIASLKTENMEKLQERIYWMSREFKAYLAADPTTPDHYLPSLPKNFRRSPLGVKYFAAHVISGLQTLYGLDPQDAPSPAMWQRPYGKKHLMRFFSSYAFCGKELGHGGPAALAMGAIQRDESLSPLVLDQVNQILAARSDDGSLEKDQAIRQSAAALLLSLPTSKLENMVLTPAQVSRLYVDAQEVIRMTVKMAVTMDQSHFDEMNEADLQARIRRLGQNFIASEGKALTRKFSEALLILLHNSERLATLAQLEVDEGFPPEWQDRPLLELLNEWVPPDFDSALGYDRQQALAIAFSESEIKTPAEPEAAAASGQGREARAAELKSPPTAYRPARPSKASRLKTPSASVAEAPKPFESAARPAHEASNKQPGSKTTYSLGHTHKQEWEQLTAGERELRMAKAKLFDAGHIGRYDQCTPELLELVRQQKFAERQARAGDVPLRQGQNLVRPLSLP